jgi:hypothetical protein
VERSGAADAGKGGPEGLAGDGVEAAAKPAKAGAADGTAGVEAAAEAAAGVEAAAAVSTAAGRLAGPGEDQHQTD